MTFESSGTPKKIAHNKTEFPLKFVVLVGARSVRNEEARRHGAASDIGTYKMLAHVQQLLIGNDLSSVGVTGLAPTRTWSCKNYLQHQNGQPVDKCPISRLYYPIHHYCFRS